VHENGYGKKCHMTDIPQINYDSIRSNILKDQKTDYFHFLKIAMPKISIYDFQFDQIKEVK